MAYTVRAPRHEDTKRILELVHAHDIAEYGAPDFEESDILNDWARFAGWVTIRSFVKGQDDVEYHSVVVKGFSQHYDFKEMPLADLIGQTELEGHHPDPWAMAMENGRMIGVVGGRIATNYNWIRRLCTLPEARGRGLGLALLQHSFRVGYDLGLKRAALGVDAQNETGALQLYLRAGMHVEAEHRRYVKTLATK